MSVNLENLGELRTFGDVIRRAELRCGGRTNLIRLTGLLDQNLRRWGDQGKFPNIGSLREYRKDLPVEMLADVVTWLCEGTQIVPMIGGVEPCVPIGTARSCSRQLLDHALEIERQVEAGVGPREGISNLAAVVGEHATILKQLSLHAFDAATRADARRSR